LLKPVSFERFRTAVNRVLDRISAKEENSLGHIMVRANKKNYRIDFNEILFLEAQGDYVKFVTSNKSLMVHGRMKDFMTQLPETDFVRIHKSFVISVLKVDYVEGNQVKVGETKLPVSASYKEQLLAKLG
jgi:two-component system, LytTR family, response regulator